MLITDKNSLEVQVLRRILPIFKAVFIDNPFT